MQLQMCKNDIHLLKCILCKPFVNLGIVTQIAEAPFLVNLPIYTSIHFA